MKACDVLLKVFTTLTPEQQADVSLFQKVCPNKEEDGYAIGRPAGMGDGGSLKEDGSWLVYNEYNSMAIGSWRRKWAYRTYRTDSMACKMEDNETASISTTLWVELEPFHAKIVSVSKRDGNPFVLRLRSGLALYVAPMIERFYEPNKKD